MYLDFNVGYEPLGQKAYLCYRSAPLLSMNLRATYDITTDSSYALDRKIERLDITLESSTI
jgi:hypothetical protein